MSGRDYVRGLQKLAKIKAEALSCHDIKCKNGTTWWLCITCGSEGCHGHQAFNGHIVRFCVVCCPQEWGFVKGYKPRLMIVKRQQFNQYRTKEKDGITK